MQISEERFRNWLIEASEDEKDVMNRMFEYGSLFDDMLFRRGTATHKAISLKAKGLDSEEWIDDELKLPSFIEDFDYSQYLVKVEDLGEGKGGYFNPKEGLICISSRCKNEESSLIHEMIHLHEYALSHPDDGLIENSKIESLTVAKIRSLLIEADALMTTIFEDTLKLEGQEVKA